MPRLNLDELLAAVEDAPPIDAADVVGERLAAAVGATDVSFLIADFSGQTLIRLAHGGSGAAGGRRARGGEPAEQVPLAGTPQGRALAAQTLEVVGACVYAPVTN